MLLILRLNRAHSVKRYGLLKIEVYISQGVFSMLNIITGKTGSGKSNMCLDSFSKHILDSASFFTDKTDAYYFVPEQFAVTEEKRLLEMTDKPLLGYEITNFKRFAYRLLSDYGGLDTKNSLTPAGALMLLTKVINDKAGELHYFTEILDSPKQISLIMGLIDEFNKYDVSPEDLRNPDVRTSLLSSSASKLDDLALILEYYRENVSASYSDDRLLYNAALDIIEKHDIFSQCDIWVDNFTGFTNIEYKFITLMIKNARTVNITLSTSLDNNKVYDPINSTYRNLTDICKKLNVEYNVISLPESGMSEKNIQIHEFADMFDEVKYCAEQIARLNKTGVDFNDFVVCCREISDYDSLIKSVFGKYNIPIHIDSKKNIDSNPLIRAIISVIHVILDNWRAEDVLSLAKTKMFPVDPDRMENTILKYGLKGKKSWSECTDPECLIIFNTISLLESELKSAETIHDVSRIFCNFMKSNNFDSIIKIKADEFMRISKFDYANEYYRTWNIVMDIFDKVNSFLGDIRVNSVHHGLEMMSRFLENGFSGSKIGFIPQIQSCVSVINIERLRSQNKKYLFFLGANEEFLPKKFDDGGLLKDSERDALLSYGISLADDTEQRSCKEYFFIDNLIRNKVDNLIVFYSLSNLSGDEMHVSAALISELKKYTGDIIKHSTELQYTQSENISSSVLLDYEVVNELFNPDIREFSVSVIEKYMQCPYRFFIESGLFVDERECAELLSSDTGNLMHDAISVGCSSLGGLSSDEVTEDTCTQIIDNAYNTILESDKYKYILKNERNLRLVERLRKFSSGVLWYIHKSSLNNKMLPFLYEYSYNSLDVDINHRNCEKISLQGRIDRCDVYDKNGQKYVRVVDYKSSDHKISKDEVYTGIKLQLISYLYAFTKKFPEYKAGAVNYFIFDDDINSLQMKDILKSVQVDKKYSMNGFVLDDPEIMEACGKKKKTVNTISESDFKDLTDTFELHVKNMITSVLDGKFTPYPNATKNVDPCKFCKGKSICGIKKSACNDK